MEYTPTSLTSQLNPCDYNHVDLPYIRTKAHERKPSLLACHNLHHIKNIRKNLEDGDLIGEAISKCGIGRGTFYGWLKRYHCKRLKNYIRTAEERGFVYLDDSIENAFYKKLKDGRGNGSEYEFFLCNRKPSRWKKQTEYLGGQNQGDAPRLPQKPVINYIAVHADKATVQIGNNGHEGGNGNGKRIEEHA